jgi:glutamine synthetase
VWKAYGDNNRTCVVRTVQGRIEWRLPDPSCNVYAAIAATLSAGLNGIDQGMQAPSPCNEDLYERRAQGRVMPAQLPRNLEEAVSALEADRVLRGLVGDAFCQQFISLKRAEWDAFNLHVSDWEMQRYAAAF